MSVVKEFVSVIKSADKKGTKPYDTQATVTRVEGNTAWVHIPGGVDETPIKMTISAKAGDTVQVRVSGGTAWMTGNATAPPTDDTQAIKANDTAVKATKKAEKATQQAEVAKYVADSAKQVAEATNQHFWQRSTDPNSDGAGTGAFVTDEEQDTFLDAMLHDVQPTAQRPLHNLLMNAEGILLRAAKRIRAAFTPSGVAFYDGQGNNADNIVAAFGSNGAQIGSTGDTHVEIDYRSMQLIDKEGNTFFHVSDLRDENGNVTERFKGNGSTKSFTFVITPPDGNPIVSVTINGTATTAYTYSKPTITFNTAPANNAIIVVVHATDMVPTLMKAYTFGVRDTDGSIGPASVCEGRLCEASGVSSHAEGQATVASGSQAHAEGYGTIASGSLSHAQNYNTVAAYNSQTAIGKFNNNQSTHAFEIGNGSADSSRSNAFTVDWSGNVVAAGTVKTGKSSSSVSISSSVTSTAVNNLKHNGSVASFYFGFNLASSLANNTTLTVGTIPSGYRPVHTMALSIYVNNPAVNGLTGYVNDSGSVVIRNVSGAAISNTSATIYVGATYLL